MFLGHGSKHSHGDEVKAGFVPCDDLLQRNHSGVQVEIWKSIFRIGIPFYTALCPQKACTMAIKNMLVVPLPNPRPSCEGTPSLVMEAMGFGTIS